MKLLYIIFCLVSFAVFKVLYLNANTDTNIIIFPSLEAPDIEFIDVSGGCGSFTDCLEYIGAVLYNIGAGIIFVVLFIINLLVYTFELFALILKLSFTGIEGAPPEVNLLLTLPIYAGIALIIYRLIRSGKSED